MATLEETLALMPDNTTGEIGADDMRQVITNTWEQTDEAVKQINGQVPDADGNIDIGQGITLLPEGSLPPVGSPPGIYAFIPAAVPEVFGAVSYDTEGDTVVCPTPEGVQIGDAVVFVPGFVPATVTTNGISCDDTGWVELFDYSPQQSRKPAGYAYRVPDQAALDLLGTEVTAVSMDAGRRAGITYVIPGSLVDEAWPAYGSGSNRSPATINDNSTEGCTIQGMSATVPFHQVVLAVMHDAAAEPAEAVGFTQVGWATGSAGGAEPFTLTMLARSETVSPVEAAAVTHPTALSSAHGGGQFIIPVA